MLTGIIAKVQEYALVIVGAVALLLLIACGVLKVQNWGLKKDLAVKVETIKAKDAELSKRDALIEEMGVRTQEIKAKVEAATQEVLQRQESHIRQLERIRGRTFPEDCQGAVDTAIELLPSILNRKGATR